MMARKSAKPKTVEPEDESQDMPEPQEARAGTAQPPVSKAVAARAAVDEGYESPQQAVAWIKTRFGIDMTPQHFSAVKANDKKKAGIPPGKPGRKPKSAPSQAIPAYLAPPPKPPAGGGADLIETLEALKPMIAQFGADKVKRLVDLIS